MHRIGNLYLGFYQEMVNLDMLSDWQLFVAAKLDADVPGTWEIPRELVQTLVSRLLCSHLTSSDNNKYKFIAFSVAKPRNLVHFDIIQLFPV